MENIELKPEGLYIYDGGCDPPCQNNGICTIYKNCTCTTNFTGAACDIQTTGLCLDNVTLDDNPILLITFGNGSTQYSTHTPSYFDFTTTYSQVFGAATNDGNFSFVNSIPNDFGNSWHVGATDHTGDKGGYMFLVNADFTPDQFYNSTVNNLCIGTRYEFSVYLTNVCAESGLIEPNVRFEVRSLTAENQLLAQLSSGNVSQYATLTWARYGLSFIASSSAVALLMISDAPGGSGNDLALDDIALRVCAGQGTGFCYSK
ncbi:unnamed protein product [Adineta steineri]|uniref:EGF-like domain-containing protein n=1 Tax=Adineta steineri TaxID=433720 RepID=A0A814JKR9_9BILA|nr:unnamed protein product [Adineta steineri]CAF3898665.1 unnamed protein product [Adineta steineri]CAF4197052.1 unnamed protein product [Adineta steineri]